MSNLIHTLAVVVQVLSALGVILLVLLQHGKGADMGAAFGSGASGSLFGATGSANFLSRLTAVLAGLFFVSTLGLAFLTNDRPRGAGSLMEGVVPAAPALPGSEVPGTRAPVAAPKDVPSVGSQVPAAPSAVPAAPPAAPAEANPAAGGATDGSKPSESGNSNASGGSASQIPK